MASSRTGRWAQNGALVAVSVFLCLGAVELVLRALAPDDERNEGRLYVLGGNADMARSPLLREASVIHAGVPVQTSSHGLRDHEYAEQKPPGSTRIAFFGDSITYGQGVVARDVFTERIERTLDREVGPVEVLNFGAPGMNSFRELLYYANFGRRFEADIVVLVWVPFDHLTSGFTLEDLTYFREHGELPDRELEALPTFEGGPLFGFYMDWVQPLFVVRFFGRRLKNLVSSLGLNLNPFEANLVLDFESPAYQLSLGSIRYMHELARAAGAEFHLVIFPGMQGLDREYYQDNVYARLEAFGKDDEMRVTNLFPAFRGEDPFSLHVSIVDEHPNARGHEIAADALLPDLRRAVARARQQQLSGSRRR